MPFIVPNFADAGFAAQAALDSIDLAILAAADAGTGVVSGCAVTAQGSPNMTVAVAAGVVAVLGIYATVASGNVTIVAADGTNPRIDLVVASSAGVKSATLGTAAANPVMPAVPASSVVLAAVYVPASDTAINTNQITDKRVSVPGTGASGDMHAAAALGDSNVAGASGKLADIAHGHGMPSATAFAVNDILFPASQAASSNVNSLDDYEEGTFTPHFAYATPGTSSWADTVNVGYYTKVGNRVFIDIRINSVPTNGTASGELQITGLPFTSFNQSSPASTMACSLGGWTKASYTAIAASVRANTTTLDFTAIGSGVAQFILTVAEIPTGGAVAVRLSGVMQVAT
jgi:hypothetical protein